MRTYSPKPGDIQREWHVIDATDVVLGRLAVQTANLLRGKHKPIFAPHMDTGDFVIIVNAEKVALSGTRRPPRWPTATPATRAASAPRRSASCWRRTPARPSRTPVWGMLPKNRLGRQMLKKLKVYSGPEHPHAGPAGQAVRDHADLPVTHRRRDEGTFVADTTDVTDDNPGTAEETYEADEQGVAYTLRERPVRRRAAPPGDHRPRRRHRPPQGGRRPRPPRARHRPVDRQRPRPGLLLPEQAAPAGRQRAVRDHRPGRAAST